MPVPIYHITHIENLRRIAEIGGLLAHSDPTNREFVNIAYEGIQARRAAREVPCGPGGVLHDYVPFYFAPKSPMLYAINCGAVEGYCGGQRPIIYLVSSVERVARAGRRFVFTDGHAAMDYSDFYEDVESLDLIDWDLMKAKYWNSTTDDPNRKCRRQAEFLVHRRFPLSLVTEIVTFNSTRADECRELLSAEGIEIPVRVERAWYY